VVIQRPDEEGNWPASKHQEDQQKAIEDEEKVPRSRHNKKKAGSWKRNGETSHIIQNIDSKDPAAKGSVDDVSSLAESSNDSNAVDTSTEEE
jgi:hypothetical protein